MGDGLCWFLIFNNFMSAVMENNLRLAKKTLSYGIVHIIVATLVAYAITGSWVLAFSIGLIEPIVQTAVFAVHDFVWERKTKFALN